MTLKTIIGVTVFLTTLISVSFGQKSVRDETREWRLAHEGEIKADNGWLTVSGLFWLKPGVNTLGSAPDQNIVLPASANAENMNVLRDELKMKSPGLLSFKLNGKSFQLRPVIEDDKLFILFRDRTAGKSTYGAGRFLYAEMPKDGKVVLDFNRAENPPCAFTPYATCPLPPRQNRLPIAIPAGELNTHLEAEPPQPK